MGKLIVLILLSFVFFTACDKNQSTSAKNHDKLKKILETGDCNAFDFYVYYDDLKGFNEKELIILMNMPVAKYGKKFKTQWIGDHFAKYSWYKPQFDDVSSNLKDFESQNIKNFNIRISKLKSNDDEKVAITEKLDKLKDFVKNKYGTPFIEQLDGCPLGPFGGSMWYMNFSEKTFKISAAGNVVGYTNPDIGFYFDNDKLVFESYTYIKCEGTSNEQGYDVATKKCKNISIPELYVIDIVNENDTNKLIFKNGKSCKIVYR